MTQSPYVFFSFLVSTLLFLGASSSKVLVLHPFYGGSHILTLRRLASALTKRNHEVKIIRWLDTNSYPPIENTGITEIALSVNNSDGSIPFVTHEGRGRFNLPIENLWHKGLTLGLFPLEGYVTVTHYCRELLESGGLVQQLRKENFKVAIVDLLFNECGLALAYQLGIPVIGFWGFNFASGPAFYSTAFNPPSALPQTLTAFPDQMTFSQRLWNSLYFFGLYSLMQGEYYVTNRVIEELLPGTPDPSMLMANVSGMLINSHPAVDFPRLLPPSFLEVAGMHLRPVRNLSEEILDFINSSGDDGVILFSLGFNFDAKFVPRKVFEGYFRAFGKLKQKVLVKAKGMPSYLPPNVKIYPFFPQADILAHEKTVLFVTHCGMHGVMEAIRSNVPMLGIPIYIDQKDNLMRLEALGVAKGLDKEAEADQIYEAITNILHNTSYKENVRKLNERVKSFGDPLEKSLWLVEYVMSTQGAHHLKLASRNLGVFQYLCLDILLFFVLVFISFLFIFSRIFSKIRRTLQEASLSQKLKVQ